MPNLVDQHGRPFYPSIAKIGKEYRDCILNKDFNQEGHIVDKFMAEVQALIADTLQQERERLVAALPDKKPTSKTPMDVITNGSSDRISGFNQAIDQVKAILQPNKEIE